MAEEPHENITVLVVDDHPMFRKGVVEAISEEETLDVIGEAGDGKEALAFLDKTPVMVAVFDVDMPGMNGLQLAAEVLAKNPEQRIVFLTMHKDERIFNKTIDLGVNGYILKDEAVQGIVDGIITAAGGHSYVSPGLSDFIMARGRKSAELKRGLPGLDELTPTEKQVLKLVAQNKTSKEIAAEMFVSPRTVGTHRNNISRKIKLGGKMPLINFALLHADAIGAME